MSHSESGFEEKELKFQQSLREAQEDAVGKILENGHELNNYIEVVDNTSGFAKAIRDKTLDPTSPKLACKKKCHWCCHQSVSVTAPEVFRISEYIKSTSSIDEYVKKWKNLIEIQTEKRLRNEPELICPVPSFHMGSVKYTMYAHCFVSVIHLTVWQIVKRLSQKVFR